MDIPLGDPLGHVAGARFGLDDKRDMRRGKVDDFLNTFEDTVDVITARILLRQVYQEAYSILPKGEALSARHLAQVMDRENVARGSALETTFKRYLFYEVGKYTNLNFPDFIQQPYAVCGMQFSNIIEWRMTQESKQNSLDQRLQASLQNHKGGKL